MSIKNSQQQQKQLLQCIESISKISQNQQCSLSFSSIINHMENILSQIKQSQLQNQNDQQWRFQKCLNSSISEILYPQNLQLSKILDQTPIKYDMSINQSIEKNKNIKQMLIFYQNELISHSSIQKVIQQSSLHMNSRSKQNLAFSSFIYDIRSDNSRGFNINSSIKCSENNQISYFCIDKLCKSKNAFLCSNYYCSCNKQHKICCKRTLKNMLQYLKNKRDNQKQQHQKYQSMKSKIQNIFHQIFHKINEFKNKIIQRLNKQIQSISLTKIENMFCSVFIQSRKQYLKYLNQQELFYMTQSKKQDWLRKDLFQNCLKQVKQYSIMNLFIIENTSKGFQSRFSEEIKMHQKLLYPFNEFSNVSSIIKSNQQVQNLINFFNQKVQKISLLFKASEHQFDIKKYYQKCGDIFHTLIICQTNKNKIIGGYTPLPFSLPQQQQQPQKIPQFTPIPDSSLTSFIFSLTTNSKFPLTHPQQSIIRYSNKQFICFGGAILTISNNSHKSKDNWTYLGFNFYQNDQFKDNQQSYLKFNGNKSQYFTTKEWEVYKVEF